MKKALLLLIMAMAVWSCSNDSDGPGKAQLLTKMTTTSPADGLNFEYTLEYDSQKRLIQIVRTGDTNGIFLYYYNDKNQISSIIAGLTDQQTEITLNYDANGRIASFKVGDQAPNVIAYDEDTDIYSIQNVEFSFNDNDDLDIFQSQPFSYENDKKGPFANVSVPIHFFSSLADPVFLLTGTRKPINSIAGVNSGDANAYDFSNTYNGDGYITEATATGLQEITFKYEYTDL